MHDYVRMQKCLYYVRDACVGEIARVSVAFVTRT